MNGTDNIGVFVIERVPIHVLLVELEDVSKIVVGRVGVLIFGLFIALSPDKLSRKILRGSHVVRVINRTIRLLLVPTLHRAQLFQVTYRVLSES